MIIMKPVWKVVLYVAEALLSAIKAVFGGKDNGSK